MKAVVKEVKKSYFLVFLPFLKSSEKMLKTLGKKMLKKTNDCLHVALSRDVTMWRFYSWYQNLRLRDSRKSFLLLLQVVIFPLMENLSCAYFRNNQFPRFDATEIVRLVEYLKRLIQHKKS